MLKLVVFVVVIAVASCQARVAEPTPRKYCCTPAQWEGIQAGIGGTVTKGKGQEITTTSSVSFDRTNQRIYVFANTTTAQGFSSFKVIQDFKKRIQWTIDLKTMQCTKTNVTTPFNDGCIPNSARSIGKFYFGSGSEMLHGKSYAIHHEQAGTVFDVTVSVTEKQCIPLSEAFVGSANDVPMVVTIGFVNITPGIKDPSVFNPPAFCKEDAKIALPPSHIESQYHIFHI